MPIPKRYLIVDDVRVTRIATLKMLKDVGGVDSFHAENGQEGINILVEKSMYIDCVLVDFNMPVMHGLQMVKLIRMGHKRIRRDIPVIMITGHGDRSLLGVSMELDVNAFILKPFDKDALLNRIKQVFDSLQSGSDWLKDADEYYRVDVDEPIEELLQFVQGDRKTNISEEVTKTKEKEEQTRLISSPTEISAESKPLDANETACDVDTIQVGSILSRDIIGSTGTKLLAKGSAITLSTIVKMKNLHEMGEPLEQIVVYK